MADLFDSVPNWVKSLHQIETELREAARSGVFLQKDKALEHLAEARRHIDQMRNSPQRVDPAPMPAPMPAPVEPPLRKDGDI